MQRDQSRGADPERHAAGAEARTRRAATPSAAAAAILACALAGGCSPTPQTPTPQPTAFQAAFGPCGDPCRVAGNDGGELVYFLEAAEELNARGDRLVVIDGACRSACAAFADRARAHVCITPNARFGFHKASVYTADLSERLAQVEPPQSPDILAWVAANGGFPTNGMRDMDANDAARFWRACTVEERETARS